MKKYHLSIILVFVAIGLFYTSLAFADDDFTYRGKVLDAEGNPIQGVQIQVYDLNMIQTPESSGIHIKTVKTGRDGSYTVALHCSSFKFTYKKDGYTPETRVIENVFTFDINLGAQIMQRTIDLALQVSHRTAYPGEGLIIPFQIANRGEKVETIGLSISSEAAWQTTIRDDVSEVSELILNPGHIINLNLLIKVPVDASGVTQINLNAHDHVEQVKTLKVQVQGERPRLIYCVYPSKMGTQGNTVDFNIAVHNPFAEASEVSLSTGGLPGGWDVSWVNQRDEEIASIRLLGGGSDLVTLRVMLPQTALEGTYPFKAHASTQGQQCNTSLSINVERRVLTVGLKTRYPDQAVEMGQTVSFRVTLENPGGVDEPISLSGRTVQEGWEIAFTNEAGAYVQSVLLEAWGEEIVTVVVRPAPGAEPGRYDVQVEAKSQRLRGSLVLTVGLMGSTKMELKINNLYAQLTTGEPQTISVGVKNTGYSLLNLVGLETSFSESLFKVEFEPLRVLSLGPGETQTFMLKVTALEGTAQGDYMIEVRAVSREVESAPIHLRLTVLASRGQLVAVGSVIVAAFASVAIVYKKFRRR